MQRVVRTVASFWASPHRIGGLKGLKALGQAVVARTRIGLESRGLVSGVCWRGSSRVIARLVGGRIRPRGGIHGGRQWSARRFWRTMENNRWREWQVPEMWVISADGNGGGSVERALGGFGPAWNFSGVARVLCVETAATGSKRRVETGFFSRKLVPPLPRAL